MLILAAWGSSGGGVKVQWASGVVDDDIFGYNI